MKFAFSSLVCPQMEPAALAEQAKQSEYQGVELAGERTLAQIQAYYDALRAAKLEVCCLGGDVGFTGNRQADADASAQIRDWIDAASGIGCPMVRIVDAPVGRGQTHADVGLAMSQWLAPLADYASDHDVTLLVSNVRGFRSARPMWTMLEYLRHPSLACCWDVRSAMSVGEDPSLSVPILSTRIQHVHVSDARLTPDGSQTCPIGQGQMPLRRLIIRLRGIGYRQWVVIAPYGVEDGFDYLSSLPEAITALKQWAMEGLEPPAKPAKPAAAHKAAASK